MEGDSERLSEKQWLKLRHSAMQFRQQVVQQGNGLGFAEVFRLAADRIEADVECFCDRAERIFEEIHAWRKEPPLDRDWLENITGEQDCFYFSTENLVKGPDRLHRKQRGRRRRQREPDEAEGVQVVEKAVQNLEDTVAVSHSENVKDWIWKIAITLDERGGRDKEGKGMEFANIYRKVVLPYLTIGQIRCREK
ncbi:MAG: hypothetical protein WA885_13850 [Phormidesmis sp.]